MKTIISAVLLAFVSLSAHAAILGTPFIPEIDQRFNALEGPQAINTNYPSLRSDSTAIKHTAQATYDFAVNTGAIGTYSLNIQIPKNAIITQSYLYSITKPTTSASGTLAFTCENAADIITATAAASYATAGAAIAGSSTGAASAFKYIDASTATPTGCVIQAVIATGALTAGKVTAFVEYVLHK